MTNNELLQKLSEDMKMRKLSHYTYDSYTRKTKDMIKYLDKTQEEVTIEEIRKYLLEYLIEEKKLSDRSGNYYNI